MGPLRLTVSFPACRDIPKSVSNGSARSTTVIINGNKMTETITGRNREEVAGIAYVCNGGFKF